MRKIIIMMMAVMNSKARERVTNVLGNNYLQDGRDDQSKAEGKTWITFHLNVEPRSNIILRVTTTRRKLKGNS